MSVLLRVASDAAPVQPRNVSFFLVLYAEYNAKEVQFVSFSPVLRAWVRRQPRLKRVLGGAIRTAALGKHTLAAQFPILIQPRTRTMALAITAHCNLSCDGCRYGRDFMTGCQMTLPLIKRVLNDASGLGVYAVRLYGGEPLLHPDLPAMVRHAWSAGIKPWVTTNGILLRQRIDELYEAGLRQLTIGLYGTGADYDSYVQRKGAFALLERGLEYTRDRYGMSADIKLCFLLSRRTAEIPALRSAWEFAERLQAFFSVDLIHYSLPYFTYGSDQSLEFRPEDAARIQAVAEELLEIHARRPDLYRESPASIRSIPDWLLRGSGMRVPCDMYDFLWIGADGSVQLCYAHFPLGNVHDRPLRDIAYQAAHKEAARKAFQLDCPNCHCERETRIQKHLPSLRRYR
ncbi:MAG: radical SAM protein [Bryobacterales bacterium]|nr:radical SAM protein [Bryobacterales bacterium]